MVLVGFIGSSGEGFADGGERQHAVEVERLGVFLLGELAARGLNVFEDGKEFVAGGDGLAERDVGEDFDCFIQVERLAKANLLWLVTEQFAHIDRYPLAVGKASRGLLVAELLCSARNCARSCSTPYRSARCGQVQPTAGRLGSSRRSGGDPRAV